MSVRSYIVVLITGCCLGGLLLIASHNHLQQRLDSAQRLVANDALALRDIARFEDTFGQWMVLSDLILGSDETYLTQGALDLATNLENILRQVSSNELTQSESDHVQKLGGFIERQRERLECANTLEVKNREQELYRLLLAMDVDSEQAVNTLAMLGDEMHRAYEQQVIELSNERRSRDLTSVAFVLLFGVWLGVLWLWISRVLSSPLHSLADEAKAALIEQRKINLTSRGPVEVVQLTREFSKLVGSLDDQVNDRTKSLSEANEQLNKALVKATAADQAKSEFLANMSHEIRTPMTAVLGYAELLQRAESFEPYESKEQVDTIIANGEHLLSLLNGILDLSKIEAGKLEVQHANVSPFATVLEVASLLQIKADESNLQLTSNFVRELPRYLSTDPTRLRQILVNLVGNAIKFTESGTVNISVHCPTPDQICFAVEDTGIGIAPDALTRLFQPFTQADGSTTRDFGGTGLGLSISQRLARLMGGEISCESVVGHGSTFRLTLPIPNEAKSDMITYELYAAETQDVDELPDATSDDSNCVECRILLVEDVRTNQMLISLILEEEFNATVTVCENGQLGYEEAMSAMQNGNPYDVVLMDMQMPVLDGYAASRKLRESNYTGPIVALTAHAMADDRTKCLDAGCTDYLAKPIDREMLRSKLNKLIDPTAKTVDCEMNPQE